MKKKIVAAVMAMVLAITPCGSVLAEEVVQDDVVIEEISADEAVGLTDGEADTVESEIIEIESESGSVENIETEETDEEELFLIAVEEVETKLYDSSAAETDEICMELVVTESLEEAGLADNAMLPAISLYSDTEFTGNYGAQLSEDSKVLYDAMVASYVTVRSAEQAKVTLNTKLVFSLNGVSTNEQLKADEGYTEAMDSFKYVIQPAFDAFIYDYPEVAWLKRMDLIFSIGLANPNEEIGGYNTGIIETVTFVPVENYSGSSTEIAAFDVAVDGVVTQLGGNFTEESSDYDIAKVIHDYLCNAITYTNLDDENDKSDHSAAGVFLKGGLVVCEGYAKAFKILCNKFDIPCVLIPGYAGGAHMWNYIQMEDGNWYLVDVTWDDDDTYDTIKYTYFLVGSATVVSGTKTIADQRTVYPCFASTTVSDYTYSYSQSFVFPVLSSSAYISGTHAHVWELTEEVAATCMAQGYKIYECSVDDCEEKSVESIDVVPHTYSMGKSVSNGDATCTSDGTKSIVCDYGCGTIGRVVTDAGSKTSHSFTNYVPNNDAENCLDTGTKTAKCDNCDATDVIDDPDTIGAHVWESEKTVDKNPTCTEAGSKSIHCSLCNVSKEDTEESVTAKGHSFTNYTYNNDATCKANGTKTAKCDSCTATSTIEAAGTQLSHSYSYVSNNDATVFSDGTKTASCSYGCGTTSTVTDAGTKLTPTWKLNASKITLKVGQSTTKVKVTGLAAGDSVKSWSSSNSKIVTAKNGKITAKKVGTAYVYVRLASDTSGTTPKIKIKVTVQKTAVKTTKIAGLFKTMTIAKGKKETLSPVLYPITSVEKITYTSSNKKVAAVSSKGVITAKAAGKAKITVKAGTKKFTITVTVPKTKTTKIKNVPETLNLNLKKKKTYQLKAKCVPSNTDQKLTYSSSKPSIVKVSTTGKLTAKKAGTAVITVKSGSIKVKCKVTVK